MCPAPPLPPPRTQPEAGDSVAVGRIVGAWGLRGHLKVASLTDFAGRFAPGSVLQLRGHPATVVELHTSGRGPVVRLDVVDNRTDAEALRGELLTVASDAIEPLEPGSYYHFEIIGIGVWTETDEHLGEVAQILDTGANDVYVVRDTNGDDILLPAIENVILDVDTDGRRMLVRLPEGIRPKS